jgi:hypothetical protein
MSNNLPALVSNSRSPAIEVMLDDKLFERVKLVAKYMASAEGFTPGHLIGKTEACFAVITRSLTWKLDPFAVAQSTYSPAPGKVGFEGKLCQAIIENSGVVEGGVEYEAYGDWSKVQGKFDIKSNEKGKKYAVATYTDQDERGLGVIARAHVRGEKKPREFKIDLREAHPRNSTLWATNPYMQLCYRAARGLGNLAMPGIFMGVPFDGDVETHSGPDYAKDITPPKDSIIDNINASIGGESSQPTEAIHEGTGEVIESVAAAGANEANLAELPEPEEQVSQAEEVTLESISKMPTKTIAEIEKQVKAAIKLVEGGEDKAVVYEAINWSSAQYRLNSFGKGSLVEKMLAA